MSRAARVRNPGTQQVSIHSNQCVPVRTPLLPTAASMRGHLAPLHTLPQALPAALQQCEACCGRRAQRPQGHRDMPGIPPPWHVPPAAVHLPQGLHILLPQACDQVSASHPRPACALTAGPAGWQQTLSCTWQHTRLARAHTKSMLSTSCATASLCGSTASAATAPSHAAGEAIYHDPSAQGGAVRHARMVVRAVQPPVQHPRVCICEPAQGGVCVSSSFWPIMVRGEACNR